MIFRNISILFIFLFISWCKISFPQGWKENNITKQFKNYYVEDFCFSNDVLWVINDKRIDNHFTIMVSKCEKDKIVNYYINNSYNNNLNYYLNEMNFKDDNSSEYFTPEIIKSVKNKIWLISESNMKFAMIFNDSIKFINFFNYTGEKIGEKYYAIDSNNLFVLIRYGLRREGIKNMVNNGHKMFYTNGEKYLVEYKIPFTVDSNSVIADFYIFNNKKIFVVASNNDIYCKFYIFDEKDNLLKVIGPFHTITVDSYFIDNDKYYFIMHNVETQKYEFYVLDTNFNLKKYEFPLLNDDKNSACRSFVVKNNIVYISTGKGFFKYNYLEEKKYKISGKEDKDYYDNIIRRLKIKDKIIYGCRSGFNDWQCGYSSDKGFYIYNIEGK